MHFPIAIKRHLMTTTTALYPSPALCHLCTGLPTVEQQDHLWHVYCPTCSCRVYATATDAGSSHRAVRRWNEQESAALARLLDLPAFPAGPWTLEPDAESWVDAVTGLRCVILRNRLGTLAGYVHNPERIPTNRINARGIHRGMTGNGPLHLFGDEMHWVSVDCAHAGDLMPMDLAESTPVAIGTYRNMEYMRGLCRTLAWRVAQAASATRPLS